MYVPPSVNERESEMRAREIEVEILVNTGMGRSHVCEYVGSRYGDTWLRWTRSALTRKEREGVREASEREREREQGKERQSSRGQIN
jgi:hypothetical protein